MSNEQRTAGSWSGENSDVFIPGLATVYDTNGFFEAGLFQRDQTGTLYMVPQDSCCFPGILLTPLLPFSSISAYHPPKTQSETAALMTRGTPPPPPPPPPSN